MNDQTLPDNDKDLQLARRIGKLLDAEQLTPESLLRSEFEQVLGQLKQIDSTTSSPATPPELSNQMWAAISSATQPEASTQQSKAKIYTLWPKIAVAASIFIAVVLGWFILQPSPGPTLVAQADSNQFTYTLEDGTTVTLRPHSALYEVPSSQNDLQFGLEGEAYFEVSHNPERSFIIQAGPAQVAVLGTTFNVTNWDSNVTVYLEEGSVELTHLGSKEQIILSPGQVGTVGQAATIVVSETEDNTEYLDWLDDQIVFTEKKLIEIVHELEFHFSATIELPESLNEETYSGDLSLRSLDAALEKLSFIMEDGGSFEQTAPRRYIFEPNQ